MICRGLKSRSRIPLTCETDRPHSLRFSTVIGFSFAKKNPNPKETMHMIQPTISHQENGLTSKAAEGLDRLNGFLFHTCAGKPDKKEPIQPTSAGLSNEKPTKSLRKGKTSVNEGELHGFWQGKATKKRTWGCQALSVGPPQRGGADTLRNGDKEGRSGRKPSAHHRGNQA